MLIFLTTLLIVLYVIVQSYRKESLELPGPVRIPIVGNLVHLAAINWDRLWISLSHYADIYGGIYRLYFGSRCVVVISDPVIAHEVYKKIEWCGRAKDHIAKSKGDGKILGILLSDGDLWKETRRFTFRHLKDFGLGKANIMEKNILEEVENIIERLDTMISNSDHILPSENTLFGPAIISTLWKMVAGVKIDIDDPGVHKLLKIVDETLRSRPIGGGLCWSFPILIKLFPETSGMAKQIDGFNSLKNNIRITMEDHKRTRVPDQPKDFIDAYLEHMHNNPDAQHFFNEQLVVTCMDLFVAGSDTTTASLKFVLLYLILYPDIQAKLQEELDQVVGRNRPVALDDKDRLVYCGAFLQEVSRCGTIAPIVTPHEVMETVKYKDYVIPKGSLAFLNLWGIHMYKEHWGDPEIFRPDRFIDTNGKLITNDEWLMPFSTGKRKCPAEILGKTSIFLLSTNLLQKFTFSIPIGDPVPTAVPRVGLSLSPAPFKTFVQRR